MLECVISHCSTLYLDCFEVDHVACNLYRMYTDQIENFEAEGGLIESVCDKLMIIIYMSSRVCCAGCIWCMIWLLNVHGYRHTHTRILTHRHFHKRIHRQTHIHTHIQAHRHTDTYIHRHIHKQTDRQTHIHTHTCTHTDWRMYIDKTNIQTYIQTDWHMHIDRHTELDRHTDRHRLTHRLTHRQTHTQTDSLTPCQIVLILKYDIVNTLQSCGLCCCI
jgi:hypothetical protein